MTDPLDRLPEFFSQVQTRLLAGRREYGDRSFSAEPRQLLEEISQELLDTAAWSFILYERLEAMKVAIRFGEIQSDASPVTPRDPTLPYVPPTGPERNSQP